RLEGLAPRCRGSPEQRVRVERGDASARVHGDRGFARREPAGGENRPGGGVEHVHAELGGRRVVRTQDVEPAVGRRAEGERHVHERVPHLDLATPGREEFRIRLPREQAALRGPAQRTVRRVLPDLVAYQGREIDGAVGAGSEATLGLPASRTGWPAASSTPPPPGRSVTSRAAPRAATATGTESRGPVTILTTRSRWSKATMRLLSGSGAHDEPPSA